MKALLLTVGSRGDAEPFCALAQALVSSKGRHHEVDLFLQTDVQNLMKQQQQKQKEDDDKDKEETSSSSSLLRIHDLPFTQMDFYKFVGNPSHGVGHENPRVQFIGVVTDVIGELVLPCANAIHDVAALHANNSQVIVTSSLARPLAMALGTKLEIPVCIVHLQPLCPTDKFPHSSHTDQCVAAILEAAAAAAVDAEEPKNGDESSSATTIDFEESYWELEKFQHDFLQDRLDEVYAKLGLPPLRFTDDDFRKALTGRDGGKTWIANAFSGELIPSIATGSRAADDTATTVFDVGPLADDWSPNNAPSLDSHEELMTFLDMCGETQPICIGYGSMPFGGVRVILEALHQVDRRAILVGEALKVPEEDDEKDESMTRAWAKKDNIFHVSTIPYSQLLPHCSMMLCHGGAGVVNATLRAGIPCVISPLMGDQFFWAKLLEAKEIGVQAGTNLASLTKEDIVDGIQRASSSSCVAKAKAVGEGIRSKPSGVERLVDILEERVH